jgi:hypothetical protein
MDFMTRDELRALSKPQGGWCVSIFLPTQRIVAGRPKDPIRFKNLLRDAEKHLMAGKLRSPIAKALLSPAEALLEDPHFWQHQSDGLAAFLTYGFFRTYRLPIRFPVLVVVTKRFHLKPVLPLMTRGRYFYILAISAGRVRLLQATADRVNEVELKSLPKGLDDALKYDDQERQLQFHTRAPRGKGKRAAMFHGQGVGIDDAKDRLLRYFRQVNAGLHDFLQSESAPLILAGVKYYWPIYRQANTYGYLLEKGVAGNPENMSEESLHERSWRIARSYFGKDLQAALSRYREASHTDQASNDLKAVIAAAYHGRVDILFVAAGIQCWGKFDPHKNSIHFHKKAQPGDEDLLDFAALHAFLNSGKVYALGPEKVQDGARLAALFRY